MENKKADTQLNNSLSNLSVEELQEYLRISEEKNQNLAKLVKEQSVEIKNAKAEIEDQYEVIGRLARDKEELTNRINASTQDDNQSDNDDYKGKYEDTLKQLEELKEQNDNNETLIESLEKEISAIKEQDNDSDEINDGGHSYLEDTGFENLEEVYDGENEIVYPDEEGIEYLNSKNLEEDKKQEIQNKRKEAVDYSKINLDKINSLEERNSMLAIENSKLNDLVTKKDRMLDDANKQKKDLEEKTKANKAQIDTLNKKITELSRELSKINGDANVNEEAIIDSSHTTLLSRVMDNSLDLKLNNYYQVDKEKLIKDYEVTNLLEDIDVVLDNNLKQKDNIEQLQGGIKEAVLNFVANIVSNEACAFDYIVALKDLNNEYDSYKEAQEKQIESLSSELNDKTQELEKLNAVVLTDDDSRDSLQVIEELKKDNEKLINEAQNLRQENELLSGNDDNKGSKFIELITKEREDHIEAEALLKKEIEELKEKVNDAISSLSKFNGDYASKMIENNLNEVDKYVSDVINGNVEYNSSLLNNYYSEVSDKFKQQELIYSDEVSKRNEVLQKVVLEKQEELEKLEKLAENSDFEGNLGELTNKIADMRLLINYIDELLNSDIIKVVLEDKRALEEQIMLEFKEKAHTMYEASQRKVNSLAYDYVEKCRKMSVDEVLELYKSDCNEMASFYAKEINQLHMINEFDTNEFSKLLNNAKILMLCNEFYALVNFKSSKNYQKYNGEEIKDFTVKINDNFVTNLNDNEQIKLDLNKEIEDVNNNYLQEKNAISNEIDKLNETISKLNHDLDDARDGEQVKSIMIEIDSKKHVLDFLQNSRLQELEKEYESKISDLNMKVALTNSNEKETKELYLDRVQSASGYGKDIENIDNDILKAYGSTKINEYLYELNSIDYAYINTFNQNEEKINSIIKEYQTRSEELQNKLVAYRNLNRLRQKYYDVIKVMKVDYQIVNEFDEMTNNLEKLNKQLNKFQKELSKAKDNLGFGIDVAKSRDSIIMFQAKILSTKDEIESVSIQIEEYKNNNIVSEYVSCLEKISKLDEIIKEKEREI